MGEGNREALIESWKAAREKGRKWTAAHKKKKKLQQQRQRWRRFAGEQQL